MEGSWGVAEVLWVSPPCPGAGRAQGSACPCNSVYRQLLHWKALGKREGWAWEFAERLPQDQDLLLPRADLPWKEAGSGCSMAQPQGLLHSAGPTQHSATLLLLERGLCSGLRGAVGSRMDLWSRATWKMEGWLFRSDLAGQVAGVRTATPHLCRVPRQLCGLPPGGLKQAWQVD